MTSPTPVYVLLLSLALLGAAQGFWFSSSARSKSQPPQWFGIRDYGAAAQAAYSYDATGGVTVAVPVAVPLAPHQVQVSPPYPGLGAVQLVPCLCPISKDPEAVKPMPSAGGGGQSVVQVSMQQHPGQQHPMQQYPMQQYPGQQHPGQQHPTQQQPGQQHSQHPAQTQEQHNQHPPQ